MDDGRPIAVMHVSETAGYCRANLRCDTVISTARIGQSYLGETAKAETCIGQDDGLLKKSSWLTFMISLIYDNAV